MEVFEVLSSWETFYVKAKGIEAALAKAKTYLRKVEKQYQLDVQTITGIVTTAMEIH